MSKSMMTAFSPEHLSGSTGITHIIDQQSGSARVAAHALLDNLDAEGLALLRRTDHRLRRENTPRFLCGYCKTPVHIRVMSVDESGCVGGRRACFVHDPRPTPRDCPFGNFADQSSPAMIDGARFNGRQEGARHRFLKASLCHMLRTDPQIATADCEVLITGTGPDGRATWRRPDVLAVTTDGRRIAFDVQIAPPLLATIDGRERFYAAQETAWHWVVDTDQPERLKLQGMQDLILPQGRRVIGFNEEIAALAKKDTQIRFNLLHVTETNDLHYFKVARRIIGLDQALLLAGRPTRGPARIASDFRAIAFFESLHRGEITRAARIFDLISAADGFPDWNTARRDHLPDILLVLVALGFGRKTSAIEAKIRIFLTAVPAKYGPRFAPREWAFLIPKIAATDKQVASRIIHCAPDLRVLLDTAMTEITAEPETSALLWAKWKPLLHRLFPRLKIP